MASVKPKAKKTQPTPAPGLVIKTPTLALFIARRNSGKSYLQKHLLSILARGKRFEWIFVVSPTSFNMEWSSIVGEANVSSEFDPDWMNALLASQAKSIKAGKGSSGLIILDDCVGSTSFHQDVVTKIAVTGRHFLLTCWCSFQHWFKAPSLMRSNADYVFSLGPQPKKALIAIMEEYAPPEVDTWQALKKRFDGATQDHGALLIDNSDGCASLRTVRAPPTPTKFKLVHKPRGGK
jgi:hypothetical protein